MTWEQDTEDFNYFDDVSSPNSGGICTCICHANLSIYCIFQIQLTIEQRRC